MTPDEQAASSPSPCTESAYGAHEKTREAVCAFAARVEEIVETRPRSEIPAAVAEALKPVLAEGELLDEVHCLCQSETCCPAPWKSD